MRKELYGCVASYLGRIDGGTRTLNDQNTASCLIFIFYFGTPALEMLVFFWSLFAWLAAEQPSKKKQKAEADRGRRPGEIG